MWQYLQTNPFPSEDLCTAIGEITSESNFVGALERFINELVELVASADKLTLGASALADFVDDLVIFDGALEVAFGVEECLTARVSVSSCFLICC